MRIFSMRVVILLYILLNFTPLLEAQQFPGDPDSLELITRDIDNFWRAFDLMEHGYKGNPFDDHYIAIGSQGVLDFIPYRIQHADTLFNNVVRHKEQYLAIREKSLRIAQKDRQIRASCYALKYWYPKASFPPVYFVIGNFNSGGTSSANGLIIGAETQDNIDRVPYLVAHELIHFQQKIYHQQPTLLEQCLMEGVADFLGELISGGHINPAAFDYGEKHKDRLCREFVSVMNSHNWNDWLYGTTGKDDRPNDLGYWMGYQIARSYFEKQENRHQAIKELLEIKDAQAFLMHSGFLEAYID